MSSPTDHTESNLPFSPPHYPTQGALPSPRIEYCDGEVPPALSPLDAFARQGRLLSKELHDSKQRDRRLSRLPPYNVIRSLSRPRPGYGRSYSHGNPDLPSPNQPDRDSNLDFETPKHRPQSEYPLFGNVSVPDSEYPSSHDSHTTHGRKSPISEFGSHDLEIPRVDSPLEDAKLTADGDDAGRYRIDVPTSLPGLSRGSSADSGSYLSVPRAIGPAGSPAVSRGSDDDYASSVAGSTSQQPRKLSSSSAMSSQQSPLHSHHQRSPSANSEASNSALSLPRPSYNFSRPLSRNGNAPPTSAPRHVPINAAGPMHRAAKPGPIMLPPQHSIMGSRPSGEEPASAVSSKSSAGLPLPRGREVEVGGPPLSGGLTPQWERHSPFFEDSGRPSPREPRGAFGRRSPSPASLVDDRLPADRAPKHSRFNAKPVKDMPLSSSRSIDVERPSRLSMEVPKSKTFSSKDDTNFDCPSADSVNTVQPLTARNEQARTGPLTAEDHVSIGIECHEKGSLNESTYHLRYAAKQNEPTGMLLYALACRHGWGMRPNPGEGVRWLRKALDSLGFELLNDGSNDGTVPSRAQEVVKKTQRSQFALSVYELGQSHLN